MQKFIDKVWVDGTNVYARTKDGLEASYPFARWKGFRSASENQLKDFFLSYTGIHWPQLDEDLSFEGMFHSSGLCDRTESEDSVCYIPA